MVGRGAQRVVRDARGVGAARPGRVLEEGIEAADGGDVEVEVDAAVVQEDKVTKCVDALNVVGVGFVGLEEPRVVFEDEVVSGSICPELEQWVSQRL